jgi:hypothetical protein
VSGLGVHTPLRTAADLDSEPVDLRIVAGILVSLVVVWFAMLVLFWALRPKGVSARELISVSRTRSA